MVNSAKDIGDSRMYCEWAQVMRYGDLKWIAA